MPIKHNLNTQALVKIKFKFHFNSFASKQNPVFSFTKLSWPDSSLGFTSFIQIHGHMHRSVNNTSTSTGPGLTPYTPCSSFFSWLHINITDINPFIFTALGRFPTPSFRWLLNNWKQLWNDIYIRKTGMKNRILRGLKCLRKQNLRRSKIELVMDLRISKWFSFSWALRSNLINSFQLINQNQH